MTKTSSPRCLALLLQFICLPAIYFVPPTHAAITIGQNVENLVDTLTANPDIRYRDSKMVVCYIAVDHGDHDPDHFHDYPLSSNIGDFRDIRCLFLSGGPIIADDDDDDNERPPLFEVRNRWPLYWDQWWPPGPDSEYPFPVSPFSWRKAVGYMGAERANRLLKAHGHRGPYALVSLGTTEAHPDGVWCFLHVQIPDDAGGGERTYIVDVRTGRVEETRYCDGGTREEQRLANARSV